MIVLDASATVELVLSTARGRQVAWRLRSSRHQAHAPHLVSVEVAHALRRLAALDTISVDDAEEALVTLGQLDVRRWDHEPFLHRAWQLRANITAYDAMYVALAESLDAPLLTTDTRLARSVGHQAVVEVLSG